MKQLQFFVTLVLLILSVAHPAAAGEAIDLEKGPWLSTIATDELHALLQQANLPVVVVDARRPEVYAMGHLPGAVNVPDGQVEMLGPALSKEKIVVVYCGGPQCPHSLIVGRWLLAHGWLYVRQYSQGFPGWQNAGYPVEPSAPAVIARPLPAPRQAGEGPKQSR